MLQPAIAPRVAAILLRSSAMADQPESPTAGAAATSTTLGPCRSCGGELEHDGLLVLHVATHALVCPTPAQLDASARYAHERAASSEAARELSCSNGQGHGAIRSFDEEQRERDVEAALARFRYQPPRDAAEAARYTALTGAYASLAEQIVRLVPAGRDRDAALQHLQISRAMANAGVALAGTKGA